MAFSTSVVDIVRHRFSCRIYETSPIKRDVQRDLTAYISQKGVGPLGSAARFRIVAAAAHDCRSLRGLGTYGFIKDATGFIIGAVKRGMFDLEDYGYLMEDIVLKATDLGLGTCWLGGSFRKSAFARRIAPAADEIMPAVTAIGYGADGCKAEDWIRRRAGADQRLGFGKLFFEGCFGQPLTRQTADSYGEALEAVRLAPSASNRQPWRVVRNGSGWHFYLRRTEGYGKGSLLFTVLRLADLQRVDMGIAMCHFELTAREAGLAGKWIVAEPEIEKPDELTEYTVTWLAGE